MKKTNVTFTMATIICMAALTGCSANVTVETPTASAGTIAVTSSSSEAVSEPYVAPSEAENKEESKVEDKEESTQTVAEEFAISFDYKIDESTGKEYAIVSGMGDRGSCWTYETGKFDVGQCNSVEYLSSPAGRVYVNEGGTIVALDAYDGSVIWENSTYQGSGSVSTVDMNDNLYLSSYFDSTLLVIDKDGNVVQNLACYGDYFWPACMAFDQEDMLVITFDCDENASVTVNPKDFTYTIN
ncbi:MAG: hypothetical protein E7292_08145 [Lachnospiraceae bacterium]|nr:hypothetical protein [Lachnospiraceae bacterium]